MKQQQKKSFIRKIYYFDSESFVFTFDANTKEGDIKFDSPEFGLLEMDSFSYGNLRKKVKGTDNTLTIVAERIAVKQIFRTHKGQVDRRVFFPLQYKIYNLNAK